VITRAVLILFLLVLAWGNPASAQPLPPTCDPAFNSALNARAWMGGKRDMESAQSTIVKRPNDSLLEISCFEGRIATFAQQNNRLFSDGHQRFVGSGAAHATLFRQPPLCYAPGCPCIGWLTNCSYPFNPPFPHDHAQPTIFAVAGPNPPGGAYTNMSLDNAFINLIRRALRPYWNPNFTTAAIPAPPAAVCGNMMTIWHNAKCQDFDKNGWITLQAHTGTDRRNQPMPLCGDRGIWVTRFGEGNPPPVPRSPAPPPTPVGGLDQTLSYRTTIYPTACNSIPPVPTGLIANIHGTAHQDRVCPGVSCWYNHTAGTCN
jgi:hypothetical protein